MKIALATMHSESFRPLAEITIYRNKAEYCKRYGYALEIRKEPFSLGQSPFEKIAFICELLASRKYDWILWTGADTLVMNFGIKVEQKVIEGKDLIITRDLNQINSDVFLVRTCPLTIEWFNIILSLKKDSRYRNGWREQRAMIDKWTQPWSRRFRVLHQRTMNSYLYNSEFYPKFKGRPQFQDHPGQYQPGDWIMHWPSMALDKRMIVAQKYINEVSG